MQRTGLEPFTLQGAGQSGAPELAVDEHKSLANATVAHDLLQGAAFIVLTHAVEMLLHRGGRLIGARHLDGDGILQVTTGQAPDLGGERGREQQRGAGLGQMAQDALQVGQEADVQHAVRLVQHHVFHLVEHRVLGLDMVQQTPGRGHQHFHPFFQLQRLGLHVHAAKHHRTAQAGVFCVELDLLGHLVSQLAGGQQHQSAHRVPRRGRRAVFMLEQTLQQRQRERRRLASARLCSTHHILAREHHGNGFSLDGGHALVAHFGHGTCQRFRQRKIGKRCSHVARYCRTGRDRR